MSELKEIVRKRNKPTVRKVAIYCLSLICLMMVAALAIGVIYPQRYSTKGNPAPGAPKIGFCFGIDYWAGDWESGVIFFGLPIYKKSPPARSLKTAPGQKPVHYRSDDSLIGHTCYGIAVPTAGKN